MNISVVIPLFNEEDSLNELTHKISDQLSKLTDQYEIVFIDDGSTDNSYKALLDLKKEISRIKIIRFRKNFGKSTALAEGFKKAEGDLVFTMDADLQDDPAEIPKMIKKIEEGYDLISGWKKVRHDPVTKTMPSRFFNYITRLLTGIRIHDFNCGFKLYRNKVVKSIPVYGELHRYLPVLAHWQGFKVSEMVVQHHARQHGKSKFGARRVFSGFFDLLTVLFITRYRHKPLHFFGFVGLLSCTLGLIILSYLTIQWFQGIGIGQRPLLFLGILLLIVGMQFFSLGLIGEMLASQKESNFVATIKDVDD